MKTKEQLARYAANLKAKQHAKAIAVGRDPLLIGRPPKVTKEEKIAKRKARQAEYRKDPDQKARKLEYKKAWRLAKLLESGGTPRKRYTPEEKAEALRAKSTKWQHANKDYVAVNSRNRRARVKGADGTHTKDDIKALFFEQKGLCGLCDFPLDAENFHVDHWKPLVKGGANDKSNLKLLHPHCNQIKSSKDGLELRNKLITRSN